MGPGGVHDVMHQKRGQRISENLRKVRELSSCHWTEELSFNIRGRWLTFGACRGLAVGAAHGVGGADGKVVIERLCLSLPYVEKPFNSKVIKRFMPELRSHKCFYVSGFLCYLYMSYEHSTYISISWVCNNLFCMHYPQTYEDH